MEATTVDCLQRAAEAERKAATAKSANVRQGFFKIAEEWRKRAEEEAVREFAGGGIRHEPRGEILVGIRRPYPEHRTV